MSDTRAVAYELTFVQSDVTLSQKVSPRDVTLMGERKLSLGHKVCHFGVRPERGSELLKNTCHGDIKSVTLLYLVGGLVSWSRNPIR